MSPFRDGPTGQGKLIARGCQVAHLHANLAALQAGPLPAEIARRIDALSRDEG